MTLDVRAHIFVFSHVCASVKFMCHRSRFPLGASVDSLPLTVSLTSVSQLIDWHDLQSNY